MDGIENFRDQRYKTFFALIIGTISFNARL